MTFKDDFVILCIIMAPKCQNIPKKYQNLNCLFPFKLSETQMMNLN